MVDWMFFSGIVDLYVYLILHSSHQQSNGMVLNDRNFQMISLVLYEIVMIVGETIQIGIDGVATYAWYRWF